MRLRSVDAAAHPQMMITIRIHSPQLWAHIIMLGEYGFLDEKLSDLFASLFVITSA